MYNTMKTWCIKIYIYNLTNNNVYIYTKNSIYTYIKNKIKAYKNIYMQ